MMQAVEPTQDSGWILTHEGYNVLTENAVESRFALGNGFLGMRASRPVSRGRAPRRRESSVEEDSTRRVVD